MTSNPIISRVFDATRINEIVNSPDVFPWVKGAAGGEIDLGPVIAHPANFMLLGEHGGILFKAVQPGIYEAHTQVLREGRGRWTIDMANAALRWMFTRTDCMEVFSWAPQGNLGALTLIRAVRGVYQFTNPKGWVMHGETIPAGVYNWTIQHWIDTAPGLDERGEWFFDRLTGEFVRHGHDVSFEYDPSEKRHIGAIVEMFMGGLPKKGEMFYNRFAAMSGRSAARLIDTDPVTVDFEEAMVIFADETMFMPACRL